MEHAKKKIKREVIVVWVLVVITALYFYFFERGFILSQIEHIQDLPLVWLCIIYLTFSCLRGFTLIPVTYPILLGLIFLPAWPLYILTMIGVIVSSAVIYKFSDYLSLGEYFKREHPGGIAKLTNILKKNELPIVISWSFFPFTPTDLMCYVCGTLEINFKKFLLGVFIGESISCAAYIFLGKDFLVFFHSIF